MRRSDPAVEVHAPAKINLTLHVTGQRADGYHLLDSLVVFAPNAADHLQVARADETTLSVTGPFAPGVPTDARNLCWRAAALYGQGAKIALDKHLPHEAGIGGGSSDAAAVLRGLAMLHGVPFAGDAAELGADVPVCLTPMAQRMSGIGDVLAPMPLPALHAVLVNPGVAVPTGPVFKALTQKDNSPMSELEGSFDAWLCAQRNDLQAPAIEVAPVIETVLSELHAQDGAWLARMSGSGATCFGLFESAQAADHAAERLSDAHPDWWVVASPLV